MVNIGTHGARATVGVPGTGLSFSQKINSKQEIVPAIDSERLGWPENLSPRHFPTEALISPEMRQINSAVVEQLTSRSLSDLRDLIAQARTQRKEIKADLSEAKALASQQENELNRKKQSWFRFFFKKRISILEECLPRTQQEIERLSAWLDLTKIDIQFDAGNAAAKAHAALVRAFDTLRNSSAIWDITSERNANRVVERSYASRIIDRKPVSLSFAESDLIQFDGRAMMFENINGEDILIYPGVVLMPRADGAFALVDIRDLTINFNAVKFVEEGSVPKDAHIFDYTWSKVNKDGSPDRRFRENRRIPVCLYGHLLFSSKEGIEEEYQFSNIHSAGDFVRAYDALKSTLAI